MYKSVCGVETDGDGVFVPTDPAGIHSHHMPLVHHSQ